jgi:hypothetical protein
MSAAAGHSKLRWLVAGVVTAALVPALIAACGGSSTSSSSTPAQGTQANTLAVIVDGGPAAVTSANQLDANTLFASVTICTPGSTSACKVIDHLQVDTGSTGLRVISSVLGAAVPTPVLDPTTARPLLECVQFADGYSWGSVGTADVTLGSRTLPSLEIHLIGDPAAGSAPSSCASGPPENTVLAFGANGILGIGNFVQDCGGACATSAVSGRYYVCPLSGACTPTIVALARQVSNPVSKLSADNNGVIVQLPAVTPPGATTVSGTVLFGIGTQADNALASNAQVYKLTSSATFTASYAGASFPGSFIDSGSNGYFFASTIPVCTVSTGFYCPTSTLSQSATVNGTNGLSATVSFSIGNADQLFNTSFTAFPTLGGPNGGFINGSAGAFDFGLPFFFGRTVYVLFEGNTLNGVTAPAIAF